MKAWTGAVALLGLMVGGPVMADGNALLKSCQAGIRLCGILCGVIMAVTSLRAATNASLPKTSQTRPPSPMPTAGQVARILVSLSNT